MKPPYTPDEVVIKTDVAVLDEHTLTIEDEDGVKHTIEVTPLRLKRIADNQNARIDETNDYVPIIVGHTTDDGKEETQPEILGWAGPFEVKQLGRSKRKALFAKKWAIFKSKVALAAKYPRRSVELWLSRWEIDPISILGATAPERLLGLVRYDREGPVYRRVYPRRYQLTSPPSESPVFNPSESASDPLVDQTHEGDDQTNDLVQAVLSALQQTDVWKWVEGQMDQSAAPEADAGMFPGAEGGVDPMAAPEAGLEAPPEAGAEGPPMEPEAEEEEPVRQSASAASGSNTFVPGGVKKSKKAVPYAGPTKMSRTESDLIRYRRSHDQLALQVQQLKVQYRRSLRERDLIQLEAEGYDLDRDEEMELASTLPETSWNRHVETIRVRYRRAPIGGGFDLAERSRLPNPTKGSDRERAAQVVAYALEKNVSYEDAMFQLEGR